MFRNTQPDLLELAIYSFLVYLGVVSLPANDVEISAHIIVGLVGIILLVSYQYQKQRWNLLARYITNVGTGLLYSYLIADAYKEGDIEMAGIFCFSLACCLFIQGYHYFTIQKKG